MQIKLDKAQAVELMKAGLESDATPIILKRGWEVREVKLAANGTVTVILDDGRQDEE